MVVRGHWGASDRRVSLIRFVTEPGEGIVFLFHTSNFLLSAVFNCTITLSAAASARSFLAYFTFVITLLSSFQRFRVHNSTPLCIRAQHGSATISETQATLH
jgi:hypothetical protein